jgi:hypothetical protein
MLPKLRYDARMLRWTAVSAVVVLALAGLSAAQIHGVAPSVTSYGFGGHAQPTAPRASVTSLGPAGYGHYRFTTSGVHPSRPGHGHRPIYPGYPYYGVYYPYYPAVDPYVYGGPDDNGQSSDAQDQYHGGPTIFDRRGNGDRYPVEAPAPATETAYNAAPAAATNAAPEPAQPATVLIFKDGHKQELGNYAIVGSSLFDLTSGRRQKIALSDLDVPATVKANEDQGIDFTLPGQPSGS